MEASRRENGDIKATSKSLTIYMLWKRNVVATLLTVLTSKHYLRVNSRARGGHQLSDYGAARRAALWNAGRNNGLAAGDSRGLPYKRPVFSDSRGPRAIMSRPRRERPLRAADIYTRPAAAGVVDNKKLQQISFSKMVHTLVVKSRFPEARVQKVPMGLLTAKYYILEVGGGPLSGPLILGALVHRLHQPCYAPGSNNGNVTGYFP
ncbi:hypothetical protein NQ318_007638 [Aromia moschata]|uniref:Uncharacterized protein n=1 Tax=Aromia moschata TaxID=1265417 RepID=A0AAV8YH65_9CUCU|nr:hypothetical protein NQ318_007638 [Aromia moschata]